jgi:hypothetical protein
MREKIAVAATTLLVAATRFMALARTPWEWDEVAFCLGVRDYDVIRHFPHPPGFPLYIAAAKVVRFVAPSDFRALQFIVLLGAIALFPLTVMLAREIGFSLGVPMAGALMFVFAPNVWFYGGTAFSDIPSLALTLAACLLLLRGRPSPGLRPPSPRAAGRGVSQDQWLPSPRGAGRGAGGEGRSYLIGAFVLAIAAGFRPQSLLVAAAPFVIASWHQRRRVVVAILIIAIVIGASYLGAALASGPIDKYVAALKAQQKWVHDVDSYHNPTRPPLRAIIKTFVKPTRGAGNADRVIPILAAIGALWTLRTRNPKAALLLAMFVPLNVFSWLMLDFNAASRYVVSYAPMCTILAAEGLLVISLPLRERAGIAAFAASLFLVACLGLGGLPPIRELHSYESPLVAAAEWIRAHAPRTAQIYATSNLEMHADYYLSDYRVTLVDVRRYDGYLYDDARSRLPGAVNFSVPSGPLFEIARQRFFEASVTPPQ